VGGGDVEDSQKFSALQVGLDRFKLACGLDRFKTMKEVLRSRIIQFHKDKRGILRLDISKLNLFSVSIFL